MVSDVYSCWPRERSEGNGDVSEGVATSQERYVDGWRKLRERRVVLFGEGEVSPPDGVAANPALIVEASIPASTLLFPPHHPSASSMPGWKNLLP